MSLFSRTLFQSKSSEVVVFETPKSITTPKRISIKKRNETTLSTLNVNARAFVPRYWTLLYSEGQGFGD